MHLLVSYLLDRKLKLQRKVYLLTFHKRHIYGILSQVSQFHVYNLLHK